MFWMAVPWKTAKLNSNKLSAAVYTCWCLSPALWLNYVLLAQLRGNGSIKTTRVCFTEGGFLFSKWRASWATRSRLTKSGHSSAHVVSSRLHHALSFHITIIFVLTTPQHTISVLLAWVFRQRKGVLSAEHGLCALPCITRNRGQGHLSAKSTKIVFQRKVFISFLASNGWVPQVLRNLMFLGMTGTFRLDMVYVFNVYLQEKHRQKISIWAILREQPLFWQSPKAVSVNNRSFTIS